MFYDEETNQNFGNTEYTKCVVKALKEAVTENEKVNIFTNFKIWNSSLNFKNLKFELFELLFQNIISNISNYLIIMGQKI